MPTANPMGKQSTFPLRCPSLFAGRLRGEEIQTKSIFSVVREDDSVFARETQPYDGKDELN